MANSVPPRPDVEGMRRVAPRVSDGVGNVCRAGWDDEDRTRFTLTVAYPDGPPPIAFGLVWQRVPVVVVEKTEFEVLAAETKRADAEKREREEVAAEMSATLRGEIERADAAERERDAARQSEARLHRDMQAREGAVKRDTDRFWQALLMPHVYLKAKLRESEAGAKLLETLERADAAETALTAETAARIAAEAKVGEIVEALRPFQRWTSRLWLATADGNDSADVRATANDVRRASDLVAQHDAKGKEAGDA